jgi:DNA-binding SARP family transcriptional activator
VTFRLETFGGLSLTDAEGKVRDVQRRRLAVLALLAAADKRGLSRDQLVAYLWPEVTEESARHSLEQLLYGLRRSIADDLFLGVNPLRLNPAVLEATVAMFERALASGAASDAVALYCGPFLDGFYLNDAPEFEQWATRERSRLAGRYMEALNQLASACEEKQALHEAVEWRRKLASLDPLSAPRALGLMRALANVGDSAAALTQAQTYESLVRLELGASPDPSIATYARTLREAAAATAARANAPATAPAISPLPVPPNVTRGPPTVAPVTMPPTARRRTRLVVALAGLTVALAFAAIWLWRSAAVSGADGPASGESRVAVLPARVIGSDSASVIVAEGVMDLLGAALTGDGIPAAVDARATLSAWRETAASNEALTIEDAREVARKVNAGSALITEVSLLGSGQFRLTARLIAVDDGAERARAEQRGPVDSLTNMVAGLLAELLLRQAGEEHLRLATLTSQSLPALAEFLRGRTEHRRGHSAAAIVHFARALVLDSSFALAALELASAHGWILRWTTRGVDTLAQTLALGVSARPVPTAAAHSLWNHAMRVAWRERDRLSARDRALLGALAGPRYPRDSYAREFLTAWDEAVRIAPDRADALYSLGDLLLYQGPALGLTEPWARAAASFNRALELDSSFVAPIGGLLELAAFDRNAAEVRRLAAMYLARDSVGAQADYVRWRVAVVSRDEAVLRTMRAQFASLDLETLARIQMTSQVAGVAAEDADRASDAILQRVGERTQRQIALHNAFWLALNRGRPAKALYVLDRKRDVDPNDDLRLAHTLRGALFGDGDLAAGENSARMLEKRIGWPPQSAGRAPISAAQVTQGIFSIALWRLWRGDTTGASEAIAQLRSGGLPGVPFGGPELLEALLASHARRADVPRALQRLDSVATLGCCTLPHFINFGSARVHERAGDLTRALAAIRRGRWLFPPEYLSAYLREEGRLADLTGDREGAVQAYRHYLVLRENPEEVLQAQADSVRRQLARLEAVR